MDNYVFFVKIMVYLVTSSIQIILYLNCFSMFVGSYCEDVVNLNSDGVVIIGRKLLTLFDNKPFAAFWNIPYAHPPTGVFRFKPPKLQLAFNCNICDFSRPSDDTRWSTLEDDRLCLNVYSPLSLNKTSYYPVMVWLHESSSFQRPDFLIDEDVIVVTVSYRTGILGFLNTEDDFALGNMGAKDILTALKWVRQNINRFNGNATAITVFGSGKAATLVASLLISSAADDLYKRVIIQSGSALSPADYRSYSFEIANKLYRNLNGPFDKLNRTKLYELLTNASNKDLQSAAQDLFDSTEVRDSQRLINSFGPTIERIKKHSFVYKLPLNVYKSRMTNNIADVMIGYTNLESLHKLKGLVGNRKLLKYLNYNFQYLVPFEGAVAEYGSKRYRKILRKIMEFYFVNGTIGERSLRRYAKYVSDQVIYPLIRQARLHAEVSCRKVYLYRFAYRGALSAGWHSSVGDLNLSGATLGDEICYLFKCKLPNDVYNRAAASNERHFIKKIARLWTNFAKYGNPTPGDNDKFLGELRWDPLINQFPLQALNIGKKLKMVKIPEENRVKFWDELQHEFYPEKEVKVEL